MEHFDFDEPAEVYVGRRGYGKGAPLSYRRFSSGAEAVRYAIEQQSADKLSATVLEVEEVRFSAAEIRELYDSPDYPLPRQQSA
jgi:hypothetical protein